jgi:hypothetical protein
VRSFLLAAAAAALLLSGCLGHVSSTTTGTRDGHSLSTSCRDGACTFCRDGDCVPCSADDCRECMDAAGDCPAMDAAAAPARPLPDVSIHETRGLSGGLPDTTWEFDVAPGAQGHVHVTIGDAAVHQAAVLAGGCFRFTITSGPSVHSGSSNCGSPGSAGSSTSPEAHRLAWWDSLEAGHYRLTASAPPPPDDLLVDIEADNP